MLLVQGSVRLEVPTNEHHHHRHKDSLLRFPMPQQQRERHLLNSFWCVVDWVMWMVVHWCSPQVAHSQGLWWLHIWYGRRFYLVHHTKCTCTAPPVGLDLYAFAYVQVLQAMITCAMIHFSGTMKCAYIAMEIECWMHVPTASATRGWLHAASNCLAVIGCIFCWLVCRQVLLLSYNSSPDGAAICVYKKVCVQNKKTTPGRSSAALQAIYSWFSVLFLTHNLLLLVLVIIKESTCCWYSHCYTTTLRPIITQCSFQHQPKP